MTPPSFGDWVRRRRKALDLLQKDLADRAGCSVTALQKIEREERRPSRQLAERLAVGLDVPADEREQFLRGARSERMPPHAQPGGRRQAPLPIPQTALFGRERELAQIAQLLNAPDCGLLTLTGAGQIDVPNGRMYNLPVLLPLLKLLKLQAPDQTAFEEAHAVFELRGDKVQAAEYYRRYLRDNPSGPKATMSKNNLRDLEPALAPPIVPQPPSAVPGPVERALPRPPPEEPPP